MIWSHVSRTPWSPWPRRPDRGLRPRRAGGALMGLAVMAVILAHSTPAGADSAGPTDFETEIIGWNPPVSGIELGVVGGDSFVSLKVVSGVEVVVIGYQGEPYLRFEADGTIRRNERSPTRWQNEERYGVDDQPDGADPKAQPEWVEVANGGSYLWHDHRAHWMNPEHPPGAEPGDIILEHVIPLLVDGAEVDVGVRSRLLAPASRWPWLAGGAVALMVVVGALVGLRSPWWAAIINLGLWSQLALWIGVWGYWSVPRSSGPSIVLWAPALVAGAVAALAGLYRRYGRGDELALAAMIVVSGLELGWWAWARRHSLTHALLPTNAPHFLDRMVTAGVMIVVVAVGALMVAAFVNRTADPT